MSWEEELSAARAAVENERVQEQQSNTRRYEEERASAAMAVQSAELSPHYADMWQIANDPDLRKALEAYFFAFRDESVGAFNLIVNSNFEKWGILPDMPEAKWGVITMVVELWKKTPNDFYEGYEERPVLPLLVTIKYHPLTGITIDVGNQVKSLQVSSLAEVLTILARAIASKGR